MDHNWNATETQLKYKLIAIELQLPQNGASVYVQKLFRGDTKK